MPNQIGIEPNQLVLHQHLSSGAYVDADQNVQKAGDTMTGPLYLPSTSPNNATEATHKGYVDAKGYVVVTLSTATTTDSVKGAYYVFANANAVLRLPASPSIGDSVSFINRSNGSPSINPNGALIRGFFGNMVLDDANAEAELVYTGSTYGWV